MMSTWSFIRSSLIANLDVTLLYVVDSEGSSPGRKNFIMAINSNKIFNGSIGGGIMEVKLIELAKSMLKNGDKNPIIKQQFHDKDHPRDQSGMICSGKQVIAIIPLKKQNLKYIDLIVNAQSPISIEISNLGFQVLSKIRSEKFKINSESNFNCLININPRKRIHIFGGGHVGLALADQMQLLNYKTIIYDDRKDLIALSTYNDVDGLNIGPYDTLSSRIEVLPGDAAAIVSFGYRTDKIIFKEIYTYTFSYLGMMGSDDKIKRLREELIQEGVPEEVFSKTSMPIGMPIYSKTPAEIGISIAAQIIFEANKDLPTGRKY